MNIFIFGSETKRVAEFLGILNKRLKYKIVDLNNFNRKRQNSGYIFKNSHNIKKFISLFRPNQDAILFLETYAFNNANDIEESAIWLMQDYMSLMLKTKEIAESRRALKILLESEGGDGCPLDTVADYVMQNLKRSVCALLKHPTESLYLGVSRKHDPNDFGLPGGKVDPGETLEQAIVRELKEETGLDLINPEPVFQDFAKGNKVYYCRTYTGDFSGIIHTEEKGVVKWVSKEELLNGSFGEYNHKLFQALK